jgi:hypothetical protein
MEPVVNITKKDIENAIRDGNDKNQSGIFGSWMTGKLLSAVYLNMKVKM